MSGSSEVRRHFFLSNSAGIDPARTVPAEVPGDGRDGPLSPAVDKAGVNPELTFHGLRHTAVAILVAEGAQVNELATIMGWSRSTAGQHVGSLRPPVPVPGGAPHQPAGRGLSSGRGAEVIKV